MQDFNSQPTPKPISPKRHFSSYPVPSLRFIAKEVQELTDIESTCEESLNQLHSYHKTWDQELCKVTEYDESLEYSACREESDLTGKMNDMKITNSITDKFPKFSIASLCISDCSAQNPLTDSRKIEFEYTENLEVLLYSENDKENENSIEVKDTYQGTKGSFEGDLMETKFEKSERFCACSGCRII